MTPRDYSIAGPSNAAAITNLAAFMLLGKIDDPWLRHVL